MPWKLDRRKVAARPRARLPTPSELNHRWSLDFVADELVSGRRFRVLTVIDIHSRECLALKAGFSLTAEIVTKALEGIIAERGVPVALTQDNGAQFCISALRGVHELAPQRERDGNIRLS